MNTLTYWLARALVTLIAAFPLTWVAWVGRRIGVLVFLLDGRHRRVALHNLTMCFGHEKTPVEIRNIARENFRRLAENYACTVKTYMMSWEQLQSRIELVGMERVLPREAGPKAQSRILALGHFGLFELCSHFTHFVPSFKLASTYRALRQPGLNRLMVELRNRSGCHFYERRTGGAELLAMMTKTGSMLGLLADQHAGNKGLRLPFLGHDCSTSTAPAIFALRYRCPLHVAVCYRTGLGRWRIESSAEIVTTINGRRRPVEDITREVNQAFEAAVRRDPANWFWVHKRWKPAELKALESDGAPASSVAAGVPPAVEPGLSAKTSATADVPPGGTNAPDQPPREPRV
jgi:KDO2-lipid IV(A) lauroyltransferase